MSEVSNTEEQPEESLPKEILDSPDISEKEKNRIIPLVRVSNSF